MNLQGWIHAVARRLGFDVYNHMAGGRRFPFRVWALPGVGPLQPHTPILHGSLLALGAVGVALGFEVDLEACTSFVGFSYAEGGWNPHVATLEEFVRNPALTYRGVEPVAAASDVPPDDPPGDLSGGRRGADEAVERFAPDPPTVQIHLGDQSVP